MLKEQYQKDWDALEAILIIKKYCKEHNTCDNCIFRYVDDINSFCELFGNAAYEFNEENFIKNIYKKL